MEWRSLHGLHSGARSLAEQPEDRGKDARFDRHRPHHPGGIWNRQGARYDWTIRVSLGRVPIIFALLRIEVQLIMFGSHKVKLEGDLLDRVKKCTDACGYSSVDEFVLHALEKEVN